MSISKAWRGLRKTSAASLPAASLSASLPAASVPAASVPPWLSVAAMLADAAFEMDRQGRFTAFGPGSIPGFDPRQLRGIYAAAVFGETASSFAAIIDSICTARLTWQGISFLRHADGSTGRYRLALAPMLNAAGKVTGIAGMLINLEAPELAVGNAATAEPGIMPPHAMYCAETGLWSADYFAEQAARRFDRLDVEDLPGTLILLGFGNALPALQTATAMQIADELRDILRPTDLLGRHSKTIIAIWCDNMDHLTGAERASRLCTRLPAALPEETRISAGLVTRWPGSADSPLQLIERAELALQQAAHATQSENAGTWRVWQQDSTV